MMLKKALKNFSPDISQRHKNVDQYVSMTVANAGNSGGSTNKNGLKKWDMICFFFRRARQQLCAKPKK